MIISNWNGLAGNLELTAKPSVYIDDVQVYPDVANRRVTVMVSLMGKAESSKGVVAVSGRAECGHLICCAACRSRGARS